MPLLQAFIDAPPTAELEPITDDYTQSDEVVSATSPNAMLQYPYGMVRIRPVSFLYFCCFSNFKRLQALESLLLLKKKCDNRRF